MMDSDRWIAALAATGDPGEDSTERAPARLKSHIYSAVVNTLAQAAPLLTLSASKEGGGSLCLFEEAVTWLHNERLESMNPCHVCHARVLGERLEHAPIFWPHCPYSEFHKRSKE